jgi:hypothetical protein
VLLETSRAFAILGEKCNGHAITPTTDKHWTDTRFAPGPTNPDTLSRARHLYAIPEGNLGNGRHYRFDVRSVSRTQVLGNVLFGPCYRARALRSRDSGGVKSTADGLD